jgi:Protein of unknown function (DUF742)
MSDDTVGDGDRWRHRTPAPGYEQDSGDREFDAVSRLRPYVMTSGQVTPADDTLEIEAQVFTTDLGNACRSLIPFERRDILHVCSSTTSVAEIAARLGLHIGVVRVLVAELAAYGYVVLRRPGILLGNDLEIIERVIRGLERIV